jgi:hypothetical protein
MLLHAVTDGLDIYSVHLDPEEAQKYAEDLNVAGGTDIYEIIDMQSGRLPGEEKLKWVSRAIINFNSGKVSAFRRVWRFPKQIQTVPKVGDKVSDIFTLTLDVTEEGEYMRMVKPLLTLKRENGVLR